VSWEEGIEQEIVLLADNISASNPQKRQLDCFSPAINESPFGEARGLQIEVSTRVIIMDPLKEEEYKNPLTQQRFRGIS